MSKLLQHSRVISAIASQCPGRSSVFVSRTLSSVCSSLYKGCSTSWQESNPLLIKRLNIARHPPRGSSVSSFHTCKVIQSAEDPSKKYEQENDQQQYDLQSESQSAQSQGDGDDHDRSGGGNADVNNAREGESIVQRLRRLSMSSPEEYELSPQAYEKVKEMSQVRKQAREKGEEWKWDQRNLRNIPQNSGGGYSRGGGNSFQKRRWDDDDDDSSSFFGRRSNRNDFQDRRRDRDDFQDRRRDRDGDGDEWQQPRMQSRNRNRYDEEDGPLDYEVEMQKLRERMQDVKAQRGGGERPVSKRAESSEGVDLDASEKSSKISNPAHTSSYGHSSEMRANTWERNTDPVNHLEHDHRHHEDEEEDFYRRSPNDTKDEANLALAANDPDTFGSLMAGPTIVKDYVGEAIQKELHEEEKALSITQEEEEEDDTRFIPPKGEGWSTTKLIKQSRELLKEKKVTEAVDLYLRVLSEGGFSFDNNELRYHFHVLINECAKVGYVEMAFRLYSMMRLRGYSDSARLISSLFNACANSPWDKENNLNRIEKLLINMAEKGREMTMINYCALIKAYGRLGETVLAFGTVDKMIQESKIKPDTNVFNMLLQACITDTKNGFRHALITWMKMRIMWVKPDIYSFNLLFRAIRDCGIEIRVPDREETKRIENSRKNPLLLPPIVSEEDSQSLMKYLVVENPSEEESQLALTNFNELPTFDIASLKKALKYAPNRLAVLGGLRGILSLMVRTKVAPNVKSLTGLLDIAKPEELNDIFQLLKTYKMKGDVNFYSLAIKRCYDYDLQKTAAEVIKLMNLDNVSPNIVTWGALSLGCSSLKEGKNLLEEMDQTNSRPDISTMCSLLSVACKNYEPMYALYVMEETRKRGLVLDEGFLNRCESFYKNCQRGLVSKEMGKQVEPKRLAEAIERNPYFGEQFAKFKMRYPVWLKLVDIKLHPASPWEEQFEHFKKHKSHKPVEKEFLAIDMESIDASAKSG